MLLSDVIEDYLRYIAQERGLAKKTVKGYQAWLHNLHAWMRSNGYPEPLLADFTTATVRRYFYDISGKGLRPRSLYGYMIPLRSFGTFLTAQGILGDNPAAVVRLPKKDAPIRKETSDSQRPRRQLVLRQLTPRFIERELGRRLRMNEFLINHRGFNTDSVIGLRGAHARF